MRSSTVLGLLVLALVVGGVMWARGRHEARGGAANGSQDAGGHAGGMHAAAPRVADGDLPDITHAEATAAAGDLRVALAVTPAPPAAFSKNRYRVRVEARGASVPLADARISFDMVMPMGDHRYALVATPDGAYETEAVLPMCQSGNPRWFATVEGTASGLPVRARFRLDLAKPGSAASH
jgi:hypothetical protein